MRLLILTQKVAKNDPILGFFHRWIQEFAIHCEKVTVICLEMGTYNLPDNVKVLSLGKERGNSKFDQLLWFYQHIWDERKNYDAVFVHMNQIYVLLGGIFWKLFRKPVGLWYVHKKVSLSLKLAVKMVDYIFSVSKESFRYSTSKLNIVGHGIDTKVFVPGNRPKNIVPVIITAGRISRVKNTELLIKVISLLKSENFEVKARIIGEPVTAEDTGYLEKLKHMISDVDLNNEIEFIGKVKNTEMPELYRTSDLFVNLSDTGSIDKAVLEAMACDTSVLVSNEAFKEILKPENFTTNNVDEIAQKIKILINNHQNKGMSEYIRLNHDLEKLVPKILSVYEKNL